MQTSFIRILTLSIVGLALHGCALTDASLEVGSDMTVVNEGPLSEPESLVFRVNQFEDAREDTVRVGYKKNGFGQNMGDIATARPVTEVISDAITAAAIANGHTIGESGIVIDGVVNRFWIETDINFTNIEMACNIEAEIFFSHPQSNDVFYSATYNGSFSDKKQMGTEGNFTEIIDGALQALIDEIVFDEALAESLTAL